MYEHSLGVNGHASARQAAQLPVQRLARDAELRAAAVFVGSVSSRWRMSASSMRASSVASVAVCVGARLRRESAQPGDGGGCADRWRD